MPIFRGLSFTLGAPAQPVLESELQAAEIALACSFPPDYRDFVTTFGAGHFDGLSLRAFGPTHLARTTADDRQRFSDYWFWTESPEVWSQTLACESIGCFDSASGHDIRFHPSDPNSLFILPHEEAWIKRVADFAELVAFFREFEPDDLESISYYPWPRNAA